MNDNSNENEDLTITLERGQTLFVASKRMSTISGKFVTLIGVFTTYEAADQACNEDGEREFLAPTVIYPQRRYNKNIFYYDVTEVSLVK